MQLHCGRRVLILCGLVACSTPVGVAPTNAPTPVRVQSEPVLPRPVKAGRNPQPVATSVPAACPDPVPEIASWTSIDPNNVSRDAKFALNPARCAWEVGLD